MSTPRELRPHMDEERVEELFDVEDYEPEASQEPREMGVPQAEDISEEKMNDYMDRGYLPDESFSDIYPLEEDLSQPLQEQKRLLRNSLIAGIDGGRSRIERVQMYYLVSVGAGYILPYTTPKQRDDEILHRWWGGAYFVIDDRLFSDVVSDIEPNDGKGVTYNNIKNGKTCISVYNDSEDSSDSSRRASVSGQAQGQLAKLGDYTEIKTMTDTIRKMDGIDGYDQKLVIRDGPLYPTSSRLIEESDDQRFDIHDYTDILADAQRADVDFISLVKRVSSARLFTEELHEELEERGLDGYLQMQSDGALFYHLLEEGERSKWMRAAIRGYTPQEGDIPKKYHAVMAYFRPREKEIWRVEIPYWMYNKYSGNHEYLDNLIFTLFKDGTGPPRVIDLADRKAKITHEQERYFEKTLDRVFDNKLYPPYTG